jgi:hypothetical protein
MSNSLSNAINIQKSRERDRTSLLKVQIQFDFLNLAYLISFFVLCLKNRNKQENNTSK